MSPHPRLRPSVLTAAILLLVVAPAGAALLVQLGPPDVTQQTSYVRLVHAVPDAPPVDVYLGNESVLANVSFGDVSPYVALEAGTYDLTVTLANQSNATVYEGTLTIDPRTATTIVASGEASNTSTLAVERFPDDAFVPGENDSAVRVVHLSPDAPAVDVTVDDGSAVLAANVSVGNASDYVTVPAGNYTVEVRPATPDHDGPVVATATVSLANGTAYTALALGYLAPAAAPVDAPFAVALTEDATTTIRLPPDQVRQQDRDRNRTATP